MKHDVIIIGAGLTGLTIAYLLQKRGIKATLIESRSRTGGRIHTIANGNNSHLELGATWFGNKHTNLKKLLDDLNIAYFEQYQEGESTLVFNTMSQPHIFVTNPNDEKSYRIINGTKTIVDELTRTFSGSVILNQKIIQISDKGSYLELTSNNDITYSANNVIVTIPQKLIPSQILFKPELPLELIDSMKSTHTWMSDSIKFFLTYKAPFWRSDGKSGMLFSQIGPVTEVYDHTNYQQNQFALMGFINQNLRNYSKNERKAKVIAYLSKYLSMEAKNYMDYNEKDWSFDDNTSTKEAIERINFHPSYGNPLYTNKFMNDKLYFAGTETSKIFGGYMEGAIISALNTVNLIKS